MPKPIRKQYTIKVEFGSEFQANTGNTILSTMLESYKKVLEERFKYTKVNISIEEV